MSNVSRPVIGLVLLVGVLAFFVWVARSGVLDGFINWLSNWIEKVAPPSWSPPPKGDDPEPTPVGAPVGSPTTAAPQHAVDPPWCPDGSGMCTTDDTPIVPPVPYPPECSKDNISVEAFKSADRWSKWTPSIPLFGPLVNGMVFAGGFTDPTMGSYYAAADASLHLKQAVAIWQDAYVNYLRQIGPTVLRVTKDLFTSDGFIETTAQAAALPLVQAAHLLIAPVLGLLVCSLILIFVFF